MLDPVLVWVTFIAGNTISRALLCFAIAYVIEWRLRYQENGNRGKNRIHLEEWQRELTVVLC